MRFSTTMFQTGNNTGIEVPADLRAALAGSTAAEAAWQKLAYSHQKAHVTAVLGAKAADTRARRIAAVVAKLEG
jgi:uncharacterized protein YdeI (YjbR/CyaY-like superfamily)